MNLAQRIGQEFKTLRDDELSTKQESLVSGTNIKTINGASVLGSGDIDLSTSLSMVGNELRYTNIDGTVQAVDMSPFMDDTTNTVVSASLSGTSIIFTREDATTFTLDVSDLYDDTNLVTSVAGRNGAVILDKSDVGLGNVDNTADSAKNVLSATKLTTTRTISLTGDVTGSVSFDGSGNAEITTTVADDSHTHAFANITSKPATLSGYGITDAAPLSHVGATGSAHGVVTTSVNGFMSSTDKSKLDGIADGAEVNVQADWDATSGDAQILNKPTIPDSTSDLTNDSGFITSSSSITGNAATATKLATARTINGVSFDGTANITVADSTKLPLTGGTLTGALTAIRETKVALSSNNIDLATGNLFTKTITGATTFTVSNVLSSGNTNSFILELTNGGAFIITWWSGVKWAGGTAPTLTSAGVDILGFYSHDGGTTWRGMVLTKDSK